MGADALDCVAHGLVEIAERSEGIRRFLTCFGGDLGAQGYLVRRVQTAIGVVHQDHLTRLKPPLREHERAQDVLGYEPPGISQDVRLTRIEAENSEAVHARIHAGNDSHVPRRDERARPLEIGVMQKSIAE